jgi:hypothetical protein
MKPGDLLLTRRTGIYSRLIGFGQRLRFRGARKKYGYWTHAAIIVKDDGTLVEATGHGVTFGHVDVYKDCPHAIVGATAIDDPWADMVRTKVVAFAAHDVGREYGRLEIACLALYCLTGSAFRLAIDNQMICSALAAEALTRTGVIFPEEPLWMLPAHLAEFYNVEAP